MSGGDVIRNEQDGPPSGWPVEAMHAHPAVFDDGDAEATVKGGGQVVTMALEGDGQLEDPLRRHSQAAQFRPQQDAADDGGGTASQAAADGNIVSYPKLEAGQRPAPSRERFLGRANDQVFAVERHFRGTLALPGDGRLRRFTRLDREVQIQRQGENVEARSEVGRRCRDPHRRAFRHGYSLKAS